LTGGWKAVPASEYTFHPRYGFTLAHNAIGTFLCKSEKIHPEQSLVVHVKNSQAPRKITSFVSNPVTVQCPSEPVKADLTLETHIKISNINATSRSQNGYQVYDYEVVADSPTNTGLKCEDGNGTVIWKKNIAFVGKLSKLDIYRVLALS
jgi:hypothetical protein